MNSKTAKKRNPPEKLTAKNFFAPYEEVLGNMDQYEDGDVTKEFIRCPCVSLVKKRVGPRYRTCTTIEGERITLGEFKTHTAAAVAVVGYQVEYQGTTTKKRIDSLDRDLSELYQELNSLTGLPGESRKAGLLKTTIEPLKDQRRDLFDLWDKETENNIKYLELYLAIAEMRGFTYERLKLEKPTINRKAHAEKKSAYQELYTLENKTKTLRARISQYRKDPEKYLDGVEKRKAGKMAIKTEGVSELWPKPVFVIPECLL